MPELPEVEHVVRFITPEIEGARLRGLLPLDGRGALVSHAKLVRSGQRPAALSEQLAARRVRSVRRRAKLIVIELDAGLALVIHLKITGKLWVVPEGRAVGRHDRVRIGLPRRRALVLEDMRKFGWIGLFDADGLAGLCAKLGPEPLDDAFRLPVWRAILARRPKSKIKAVLLDQAALAGVGNIYADEICHAARVSPHRRCAELAGREEAALHRSIRKILTRAVDERSGAPDQKRVGSGGTRRDWSESPVTIKVFQRHGERCPTCRRATIERSVVGTRGTHACPRCQP